MKVTTIWKLVTAAVLSLTLMAPEANADGAAPAPALEVAIAYVGHKHDTAWLGAEQGLEEANVQGQFLGQTFKLVPAANLAAVQALKPAAVIVAADAATLKQVGNAMPATPVLDLTLDNDGLRDTCTPNLLYIQPSQAMKKDGATQWARKHPGSGAVAKAWHPDAKKYSAIQLNERFKKSFSKPMDDHAWAGWVAVKMLADSVLRVQSAEPAKLLAFMKTDLEFDGQKGVNMNFRPNGQLRQPLMVVEKGKLVGEAPVMGVAASVEDLDSLGNIGCMK